MNFCLTDSGRKASGFNERRDCTVRAVAAVFNIPYPEAHARLKALGRKERRGIKFAKVAERLGLESCPQYSCGTIEKLLPELQSGRYIVRKAGHVFSVIDGTIVDNAPVKPKSRVQMTYRIKPIEAQKIS